ncbi:hypothetical protein ACU4GD_16090 [Cupriavidus basilensis]
MAGLNHNPVRRPPHPHPAFAMTQRIVDPSHAGKDFEQRGFLVSAIAKAGR